MPVYSVFVRLPNGEFQFVAARDELQDAVELAQELHTKWPNEYMVRNSEGNIVEITPQGNVIRHS